ncbi:hypothetical protein MHC_04760 [Mycoplasma haemocanis str. Illinois]|uniref:Uncharacterized protein n=1 Tax=Mycoplasma haemocanis (strain Illinois) TaxID=1111676 RepID=H6N836_MYCHN|nr:hypothetical protein [Mycoplasma haemocanis]AEW45808.1 hypothetical protein MHC_04760 [Mycoplasma haemocanis str. Illinois]
MAAPWVNPLLCVVLTGTAGVVGYCGSKFVFSKSSERSTSKIKFSVASLIAKDVNKELLTKDKKQGSDADWKAAWGKYKAENNSTLVNGSDPWKISNGTAGKPQDQENAPSDFMNKCDIESKKEVLDTSDQTYKNVYNWCTKDKVKS